MHPWKKIIRGNIQEEKTTTCFMCLERVTNIKFEKHMTKFHSATSIKLEEMCRKAEEKQPTEGLNFDEIINTCSLECFLCKGNWTGDNKEELEEHLEKGHKVVFKVKELMELSEGQGHPEELEPAADGESQGERERLLTPENPSDKTSGEKG